MRDFPYMHLDKTGLAQSKSTKRVCRFIPGFRYVPWLVLWFIALLILSNVILPSHRNTAYAEQNDNSRWENVKAWKGTISLTGAYRGRGFAYGVDYDEVTINESMRGSINLSFSVREYDIIRGHGGDIIGSYSIDNIGVKSYTCEEEEDRNPIGGYLTATTQKGGGSIPIPNDEEMSADLVIYKQNGVYEEYTFNFACSIDLIQTSYYVVCPIIDHTYSGSSEISVYTGHRKISTYGYLRSHNPLPESGLTLSGNQKCTGNSQFGYTGADYEITWNLSPSAYYDETPTPVTIPTPTVTATPVASPTPTPTPQPTPDKKSKYDCEQEGCSIAVQSQTLGETIGIVGVPFSLKYQSDRVSGRSGTSSVAVSHAEEFGGWTLNVHHVYDPDGSGLFLGDGGHRDAEELGSVIQMNSTQTGFSVGDYIIAAEDGSEIYVFDSSGKHQRTVDPYTKATRYQFAYDGSGHLTTVTDGYGNATTIERNTNGNPTAIVGPYGQRTTLALDVNGYLEKITNPAGESFQFKYTSGGLLTGKTDPKGNENRFSYNEGGRLISDSDPAGGLKTISRSDVGNGYTVALNTSLNRKTTYQVENLSSGEQRRINTFPTGLQTEWQKGTGTVSMSFPEGTQQSYEYGLDPRWGTQSTFIKNSTTTTANGLTSTNEGTRTATLTDNGDPFSIETLTDTTSINGRAYTSAYDAATRTSTSTTPEGRKSFVTVDARGRIEKAQVDGLHPINYSYDSLGRLSGITQGNSTGTRTTSFSYQSDGNLLTIVDPIGQAVDFEYDKAGRVTRQTLPDGRQINYTYDANGNVTTITPPGRQAHTFDYTPVDLNSIYTPPKVGRRSDKTKYSYNTDQQLTKIKRPDRQTVNLRYDSAGRLSTISVKGKKRSTLAYYQYNITGNVETITTSDGDSLSFGYDGNMILDETWSGTVEGKVSRAYNNDFQISSIGINDANTIDFKFDKDGSLTQAGELTLNRNTQNGLVTGSTLGNITDTWSYNDFGEPTEYHAFLKDTALYRVQYVRDKLGRIKEKTEKIEGEADTYVYAYDLAGRLREVQKNGVVTATYTYDSNGNRLTFTDSNGAINGSYDDQDRLKKYGDTKYEYTVNGELLSKSSTGKITRYEYDVLGNLKSVTLPDGKQIEYVIDGRNRRIGKKVKGTLTQGFLYQGSLRPVAELDNNGNIVSRFIYANRINVPDYMIKSGVTYRIITDHLGSPRLVIDVATGIVAQRIDYDTFGNVTNDTNPGFQPFGFAGGLYDQDTKLVRFGTRDYDAETGRWTAKDLIGFAGGDWNLYRYVKNNPVSYIDADGKNPVGIIVVVGLVGYASWEIYDWIKTYADETKAAQERFDKKMESGDVYEAAVELSGSTVNIAASCTQSAMELSGTSITGPVETDIPGFVADQIKGQLRETLKK